MTDTDNNMQGALSADAAPILKRALVLLDAGDFGTAAACFDKVLAMEPDCAEANWGKFLAKSNSKNGEAFVRNVMSGIKAEGKYRQACPPMPERVEAAVRDYAVANYLSEAEIRKLYPAKGPAFLETAESVGMKVNSLLPKIMADVCLNKARCCALGELKNEIESTVSKLNTGMSKLVADAKAADEAERIAAVASFEAAYYDADSKAEDMNKSANDIRCNEYNKAVGGMMSASTEAEYMALSVVFRRLTNYKDSAGRAAQCMEMAQAEKLSAAYNNAIALQRSAKNAGDYDKAANAFKALGSYRNSEERKNDCLEIKNKAAKKRNIIIGAAAALLFAIVIVFFAVIKPGMEAKEAAEAYAAEVAADEAHAAEIQRLIDEGDADEIIAALKTMSDEEYQRVIDALIEKGKTETAFEVCMAKGDKGGAYEAADAMENAGYYEKAAEAFEKLGNYNDAAERASALRDKLNENTAIVESDDKDDAEGNEDDDSPEAEERPDRR